jgi:hypothetical protein
MHYFLFVVFFAFFAGAFFLVAMVIFTPFLTKRVRTVDADDANADVELNESGPIIAEL